MKLTQEQLKKIINEELQKLSEMNEHEFVKLYLMEILPPEMCN